MKLKFISQSILLTLFASLSCLGQLNICSSTALIDDLVKQIAGDHASRSVLIAPGIDPHLYTPTTADLEKLNTADIVLFHGLNLEARMDTLIEGLQTRGKNVYIVTSPIKENQRILLAQEPITWDPHVWFDPGLWTLCANELATKLGEHDPEHKEHFKANAAQFSQNIYNISNHWKTKFSAHKNIQVVSAHDAFNYLGRFFDLKVVALQGATTSNEASLADIRNLTNWVKNNNAKVVFWEFGVPPEPIKRVAHASKRLIKGPLFSDTFDIPEKKWPLNAESMSVDSYEAMLTYNLTMIWEYAR